MPETPSTSGLLARAREGCRFTETGPQGQGGQKWRSPWSPSPRWPRCDMPRIPTPSPGRLDEAGIVEAFAHRMMYSVAKDQYTASYFDVYQALAFAVRDRLMERWFRTQSAYYLADAKRVYYLSLEFLLGRALVTNVINLGARDAYTRCTAEPGLRPRGAAGAGVGRGPRQRWPGPARGLHHGLGGDPGAALLRLRHPLRVRDLPAAHRRGLPESSPRTTGFATATRGRSPGPTPFSPCASTAAPSTAGATRGTSA